MYRSRSYKYFSYNVIVNKVTFRTRKDSLQFIYIPVIGDTDTVSWVTSIHLKLELIIMIQVFAEDSPQ